MVNSTQQIHSYKTDLHMEVGSFNHCLFYTSIFFFLSRRLRKYTRKIHSIHMYELHTSVFFLSFSIYVKIINVYLVIVRGENGLFI